MRLAVREILRQPFYPWLLGMYPILHLYAENFGLVIDSEVMLCILLMLAGTSVVFAFICRFSRNIYLAAMLTSVCSLAFSLSGHVYVAVFIPRSLGVWTALILFGLAILCIALIRRGSRKFFAQIVPSYNLVMLVLLTFQFTRLVLAAAEVAQYEDVISEYSALASERPDAPKAMDSATKPDIYYIIPDSYPSNSVLQETANFDNSAFTQALEDRGFVVVNHAQSNYPITVVSLASTLNMRYFASNPSPYDDQMYLGLASANSEVARFLLESGYTYVQLLSNIILPSPLADMVRDFTTRGAINIEADIAAISGELKRREQRGGSTHNLIEIAYKHSFFDAYFDTTLMRLARSRLTALLRGEKAVRRQGHAPELFLETIEEAAAISAMPEATFAIIHLFKPHAPVVFNEKGEHISEIPRPSAEEFGAQMRFINTRFLYLIDAILSSSENPPVIIFQADHGSELGRVPRGSRMVSFDVYAAYYVPPLYSIDFPRPYTTVNAFPLILKKVFDTKFKFQPDRLFELTQGYKDVFAQADVTEEFLNEY